MRGLSLVAASGGHSSSRCAGLSLSRPLLLRSTSSRRAGSVVVAHGPSCSAACGIFPDQGSNLCPLHWQADSQALRHQGSPNITFICTGKPKNLCDSVYCDICFVAVVWNRTPQISEICPYCGLVKDLASPWVGTGEQNSLNLCVKCSCACTLTFWRKTSVFFRSSQWYEIPPKVGLFSEF